MIEQEGATAPLTELLHSRNEGVGRILSTFLCKPERPTSVANPGCLSRIMIFIHPRSRIQQQITKKKGKILFDFLLLLATSFTKLKTIPDPGSNNSNKIGGGNKFGVLPFLFPQIYKIDFFYKR
jgi:hypothetical protein